MILTCFGTRCLLSLCVRLSEFPLLARTLTTWGEGLTLLQHDPSILAQHLSSMAVSKDSHIVWY